MNENPSPLMGGQTTPFYIEGDEATPSSREPSGTVRGWSPAPKAQSLILPTGSDYPLGTGERGEALGTGIILVIGSARSGKSVGLAIPLIEWALRASKKRRLACLGMPDEFIEAWPDDLRERISNPPFTDLTKLRDSIVLIDDTAVHLNSRDSAGSTNRMLHRMAGVISHLGLTLVLSVQSMAGVDVGLLRFCEMAILVKRIDPMALQHERSQWTASLSEAQRMLKAVKFNRSFYVSTSDELLCESPFPDWVRDVDPLSRPFRYISQTELDAMLTGKTKPANGGES
jgi:hypothetical protein